MMIAEDLSSESYPVTTEMTGAEHIPISHLCSTDNRKSKYLLLDKNLSQVCFTDKDEFKKRSSMKVLRRKGNQNASTKAQNKEKY